MDANDDGAIDADEFVGYCLRINDSDVANKAMPNTTSGVFNAFDLVSFA